MNFVSMVVEMTQKCMYGHLFMMEDAMAEVPTTNIEGREKILALMVNNKMMPL